MKKILLLLSFISAMFLFTSCKQTVEGYQKITPQEAKSIIDNEQDYIILDVRRLDEYNNGHIPNAIVIPNEVLSEQAESILTNKDQLILVYCRSGKRSKEAALKLISLGYTNVKDLGGIIDWPYEIE